ncbi:hypothetical protein RS030_4625 [Cryptosporidium xiaoi]|uniref:SPX domain-containing protein n=1 Tax=Cryptosporidium xiaoi TaxID=659607 RepID=A0AAV9XV24_9CRYT
MTVKSNVKIADNGLEIIKFSKGIQVQARNNRGTRYLNYKLLIRKIRWVFEQEEEKNFAEAQKYDLIFKDILLRDINRMDSMYSRDISYIRDLMCILSRDIWSISVSPQSNVMYSSMRINNRADDINNLSSMFISSLSSLINPSFELVNERKIVDWLHNLLECCGKLAKLRSYIIWNSIAVIKVLKKRKNKISINRFMKNPIDAYSLLNSHEFYKGLTLEYLNRNLRNIMVKVFKKDMFSEVCQKCKKKTFEPIKSICNHILCWRCIISVNETLIVENHTSKSYGNFNTEDNNGDGVDEGNSFVDSYSLELNPYFKPENNEEDSKPISTETKNRNQIGFKKIRNRPFKNCPVCHMKWSRNPVSLQVENKLIKLCIQEYKNKNFLTGILELDTIVQSSVSNVGFISSDEESEEENFSENDVGSAMSINNEYEVSDCYRERKINKLGVSVINKDSLSPSTNFSNSYNISYRPQSSLSTITSSNNSTDDNYSSSPGSKSYSNLNFNQKISSCNNCNNNFCHEYEFDSDIIGGQRKNHNYSNNTYAHRINPQRVNLRQYNSYNVNLNNRNKKHFDNEWEGNNLRQEFVWDKINKTGNDFRCNNSNISYNHSQNKHFNQKKNYHSVMNHNRTSDHQQNWSRSINSNNSLFGNTGMRNFEYDNCGNQINKNRSLFFYDGNSFNNGNNPSLFNFQNQINGNIWSNGYQGTIGKNSVPVTNNANNRLGLNINYNHSTDLNVDSSGNLKVGPTQVQFNNQVHTFKDSVVGGDRLWEPSNIQMKYDNKRTTELKFNGVYLGTNLGVFLNNNFLNDSNQDYNRAGNNNNVFSAINYNFNDGIVSLDSKLLELFEGFGI